MVLQIFIGSYCLHIYTYLQTFLLCTLILTNNHCALTAYTTKRTSTHAFWIQVATAVNETYNKRFQNVLFAVSDTKIKGNTSDF